MKREIICAGFGGQGILLFGKVLAQAGMVEGLQVTFLPSYGPEMRGGTANCHVILSDQSIGSPIIGATDYLVAMNQPSFERFISSVRDGGCVLVNTTLAHAPAEAQGRVRIVEQPFSQQASDLGNVRVCSMVAVGRLLRELPMVNLETAVQQMKVLTEQYAALHGINEQAIRTGYNG